MSRDSAVAQAQAQRIGDKKNRGSLSSSGSAITVDPVSAITVDPVSEENPAKPLLSPKTTAVNDEVCRRRGAQRRHLLHALALPQKHVMECSQL